MASLQPKFGKPYYSSVHNETLLLYSNYIHVHRPIISIRHYTHPFFNFKLPPLAKGWSYSHRSYFFTKAKCPWLSGFTHIWRGSRIPVRIILLTIFHDWVHDWISVQEFALSFPYVMNQHSATGSEIVKKFENVSEFEDKHVGTFKISWLSFF